MFHLVWVCVVLTFMSYKETLCNNRKLLKYSECACHLHRKNGDFSLKKCLLLVIHLLETIWKKQKPTGILRLEPGTVQCALWRMKDAKRSASVSFSVSQLDCVSAVLPPGPGLVGIVVPLPVLLSVVATSDPFPTERTLSRSLEVGGPSLAVSPRAVPPRAHARSLSFSVPHFLHRYNKRIICETNRCLKLSGLFFKIIF